MQLLRSLLLAYRNPPQPLDKPLATNNALGMYVSPGPGPRYTTADDKQRAFDALVDPGMRDALRVRAQTLLRENPCGLRALQMVNTDQGGALDPRGAPR